MNRDHYLSKRLHHQHRMQVQQGIQEKQAVANSKLRSKIEAGEKTAPVEDVSRPEDGGRK